MTTRAYKSSTHGRSQLLAAVAITFFGTLLGGQSHAALVIPANPLQSGTQVAPNILFILDDSGSMEEETMRNQDVSSIRTERSNGERLDLSSIGSPINSTWSNASDDRKYTYTYNTLYYNPRTTYQPWMKADKTYTAAVTPSSTYTDENLAIAVPARTGASAKSASDKDSIQDSRRKFYVPNDGITNLGDLEQYTYYELTDSSSARKCVTGKNNGNWIWNCSAVTSFSWTAADGTTVTRTVAQEWQNYATWYGYHRTRIKAAKAGASYAFAALGENYRVGYRSIWGRRGMNIPTDTGGGLFKDVTSGTDQYLNRTIWFERLYAAEGSGGTPLQGALQDAGEYFTTDQPYQTGGDSSGMLACRQNFSILTTDGYWNDNNSFNAVGNVDNTSSSAITGPPNKTFTYTAGRPYSDSNSDTLGDIAMHFWKTDLRTDLDNIVPSSTANPAFWQHMVTFGISIGLKGLLSESDIPALTSGSKSWGDPSGENDKPEKIDDLLHASVNGRGKFVAATDPDAFTRGLRSALATIDERTASASNVSFNGTTLTSGSRAYVASFVSGRWTGDLKAFPVTGSGVSTTESWSAAANIPAWGSRSVLTFNGNNVVPTTFPTTTQEPLITTAIANYVKGNRAGEGTLYRARSSVFGDVVNSSPVHVKEGTTETVYVGANDGMLHAIDATNGQERWTYVPGLLDMAELKQLSLKDEFAHKFFVDGPIVVTTRQQTTNKNMLIGTLGRGGKGVYGLNVTNPTSFATTGRAWEFAGDNDMGHVLGRPLIVKLNNTGNTTAVLVPNGINSTNDKAALFILNAETGAQIAKITTNAETANGLSMPTALDVDNNGTADVVYAGDLQGNVWKFDISSATTSNWAATKFFTATHTTTVGTTTTTRRQPITGGITVAYNPMTFHPWVLFGTGRYITETDPNDRNVQSWYGMEDNGTAVSGRDQLKEREIKLAGTINGRKVRAFEKPVTGDMANKRGWVVNLVMPPNATAEGERMIGDQFVVAGSVLMASSIIPSDDGCGTGGRGYLNFIDAFSGGATSSSFIDLSGDGKFDAGDELQGDVDGDGDNDSTPGGSVDLGVGMGSDPSALFPGFPSNPVFCTNGSNGVPGCIPFAWGPGFGRISWREVLKD